ncbi:hypothetical protein [Paenisporosarcina quisquiliarum]|uniref:hypothetical protein n=1 Tax=Paenisporosarcina quisquiliarum TaxID=365346 RepID=UPI003736308C
MGIEEYLIKTERKMKILFQEIQILSEVKITYKDYLTILGNFKKILERYDAKKQSKIVGVLWQNAPKTCLVITVNYAIYNYDGNFWGKFKNEISLIKDHDWKVYFLRQLKFESVVIFGENSAQKYVENILGHAGIPKNNIHELIKNVIEPAAIYDLNVEEIIESVKKGRNDGSIVKTYGLYKSVKDFIRLDNLVSNNLLSRCLEVWKENDRPFTEKYRSYLPDHILEEFEGYANQKALSGTSSKHFRIARPILSYSPEFQNVFIKLPIQRFGKNEPSSIEWRIFSKDTDFHVVTKKYSSPESGEVEFIVDRKNGEHPVKPLSDYTVNLIIDGKIDGEWAFYLDEKVVFDVKTYNQINKNFITIPNVLLIVNEQAFNIIDKGINKYIVRPLSGYWLGFYEIDLFITEIDSLEFETNTVLLNPLRSLMTINGELFDNVKSDTTIYINQPFVNIDADIQSISKDLSKWNIRLSHTYTKKTLRKNINEINCTSTNGISINLSDLFYEMGEVSGKYSLSLTGVLGFDESIEFIYLSENDFNFSINNGTQMYVTTSESYDFTIPTILEVETRNDLIKSFSIPTHPQYVNGNLLNKISNERIELILYTNLISYEIRMQNETKPMGLTVETTHFDFNKTTILLDLENPSLFKDKNTLMVILKEKLKTGEYASKTFNCRKGRKHVLELDFFQNLHGTASKRTIALSIPELDILEKVVTVETEWILETVHTPSLTNNQLSWNCSFQPEQLTARIWSFRVENNLFLEKKVDNSLDSLNVDMKELKEGYYIFELAEYEEDDIFSFLDEVKFPVSLNKHNKLIKVDYYNKLPSFTEWLLLQDEYGDEREWGRNELEALLRHLWKHELISLPLLLENYYSCCDFGVQNIDQLLSIFHSNEDKSFITFINKISGYHDWDSDSFKTAVKYRLVPQGNKVVYAPDNLILIEKMSRRERALSYQRTKKSEQCISDFSIKHEYLALFEKVDFDKDYRRDVASFFKQFKRKFEDIHSDFTKSGVITKENNAQLNKRKFSVANELYNFPYYIGLAALSSALIIDHESKMESTSLFDIKQIIPNLFEIEENWYLHDLVYWKNKLLSDNQEIQEQQERKSKYEHTSFAWKKSN